MYGTVTSIQGITTVVETAVVSREEQDWMRIEPFQLERWMTTYEIRVKWDIAESGIFPMSTREIIDLLPEDERDSTLHQLLDLRLGYSEACGSAELRGLIAETYENTSIGRSACHDRRHRSELSALQRAAVARRPGRRRRSGLPATAQRSRGHRLRRRALDDCGETAGSASTSTISARLATPGTRMIVINTPHNPTGAMLSAEELKDIYALAEELDAWVLSDEAYRWLDLPGEAPLAPPMRNLGPRAISTGTFSKPFGLPGLRIGWIAAPRGDRSSLLGSARLHQPQPRQAERRAGGPCVSPSRPDRRAHARDRAENLRFAEGWFADNAGSRLLDAAARRFPGVDEIRARHAVAELANQLAEDYSVMLAPGSAFGYEGYLRIGVGNTPDVFAEGLRQTARCLRDLSSAGVADSERRSWLTRQRPERRRQTAPVGRVRTLRASLSPVHRAGATSRGRPRERATGQHADQVPSVLLRREVVAVDLQPVAATAAAAAIDVGVQRLADQRAFGRCWHASPCSSRR